MYILHSDRVMGRARLMNCRAIDLRYHDRALNPIKLNPSLITNDLPLKHPQLLGLKFENRQESRYFLDDVPSCGIDESLPDH
jgi:hypothetical protein